MKNRRPPALGGEAAPRRAGTPQVTVSNWDQTGLAGKTSLGGEAEPQRLVMQQPLARLRRPAALVGEAAAQRRVNNLHAAVLGGEAVAHRPVKIPLKIRRPEGTRRGGGAAPAREDPVHDGTQRGGGAVPAGEKRRQSAHGEETAWKLAA